MTHGLEPERRSHLSAVVRRIGTAAWTGGADTHGRFFLSKTTAAAA